MSQVTNVRAFLLWVVLALGTCRSASNVLEKDYATRLPRPRALCLRGAEATPSALSSQSRPGGSDGGGSTLRRKTHSRGAVTLDRSCNGGGIQRLKGGRGEGGAGTRFNFAPASARDRFVYAAEAPGYGLVGGAGGGGDEVGVVPAEVVLEWIEYMKDQVRCLHWYVHARYVHVCGDIEVYMRMEMYT